MRVRARVSPSGRSTNGLPGRIATWPALSPGTSRVRSANRSAIRGAPRICASASASSSVSRKTCSGLIGIVAGIHDDLEVSGAPGDDADAVAVAVLELEPQADAGQHYLFDIHGSILAEPPSRVADARNSGYLAAMIGAGMSGRTSAGVPSRADRRRSRAGRANASPGVRRGRSPRIRGSAASRCCRCRPAWSARSADGTSSAWKLPNIRSQMIRMPP